MRSLIIFVTILCACEKTNPNLCCTDEADCAGVGLDEVRPCKDDKVCRGNVCVVESCATAAECNLTAPYCADESCQDACSDNAQCPGFSQAADNRFCVAGGCVECRDAADCGGARPACSGGRCVACSDHAQCASGICAADGSCAEETSIAYVDRLGGPTNDCTRVSPCSTIERALAILPSRPYVVIAGGRYARTGALTITGPRWLVGTGTPKPVLDRDDDGPVVLVEGAVTLRVENLELSGATGDPANSPLNAGNGLYCRRLGGSPDVELRDVLSRNNSYTGIRSLTCTITIVRSVFTQNPIGAWLQDSTATIDRTEFVANGTGANLDGGRFTVTNTFATRNGSAGIELYSDVTGSRVEFNTIVDNAYADSLAAGFHCNLSTPATFPNNVIARNRASTAGTNCSYPGSIIVDNDISALKFKQPDNAPYDYHITAGSLAIDMATVSTLDHDFDGDARPKGAGRDVGADEAQ